MFIGFEKLKKIPESFWNCHKTETFIKILLRIFYNFEKAKKTTKNGLKMLWDSSSFSKVFLRHLRGSFLIVSCGWQTFWKITDIFVEDWTKVSSKSAIFAKRYNFCQAVWQIILIVAIQFL